MHPELKLLQTELERSLAGLDDRQTQVRPMLDSRRWNIQQIIGHLLLTYSSTINAVDTQIAKQVRTRSRVSFAQRIGQFVVLRLGWFPPRRKAPAITTPASEVDPASGSALSDAIAERLSMMDARIADAERLFGVRCRAIRHMILGPLSLPQWCRFHLIHGRHHIRQIAAIRAEHEI
jgi:hypothetical protein